MTTLTAQHRRGIVYMVSALCVLICLDAASKYAVQKIPVITSTWSRYLGHMIVLTVLMFPRIRSGLWRTRSLPQQLLRGLFLGIMTLFYFGAMRTLPLAQATAILFTTPILITIWAVLFLREKVHAGSWFAVVLGFIGVFVVVRPGGGLDPTGVMYALGAAVTNSLYQTLTRKMSGGDAPETQLFYAGLVGAMALTLTLPAWWTPVTTDASHWFAFTVLGVLGAFGHWLMTKAYQHAPASVLTPWMYLQLFLAIALGWLIFGDAPDGWAMLGMALIALAPQTVKLFR